MFPIQTSPIFLRGAPKPIRPHHPRKEIIHCQLNFRIRVHCNIELQQYSSKLEKGMQKSSFSEQIPTETSIEGQKCIKPCLKYENTQEISTIMKQEGEKEYNAIQGDKLHQEKVQNEDDSLCDANLDEDILQEHKAVLEALFRENSMPLNHSQLIKGNQKQTQKSIETSIFKQITLEHYLSLLLQKVRLLKPSLVKLFHSFLLEEKTCFRFLQHLYYSYPSHIVDRVFKYLFYVWQLYYPCLRMKLGIDEVISVSKRISQKILRCDLASKSHPENSREEYRLKLRKLIKVFTLTFVLVMERCFANPYFKPSRLLGHQSEEETTELPHFAETGHKIIKRDSFSLSS